jgi:hypothetical protein
MRIKRIIEKKVKSEMKNNKSNNEQMLEDDLKRLSGIKDRNPFVVPENYFGELPMRIQENISGKLPGVKKWQLSGYMLNPKYSVTGLAAVLLIALFLWMTNSKNTNLDINMVLSEITYNDILEESPEIFEYIDESIYLEMVATLTNSDQNIIFLETFSSDSSISGQEILDYISDEILDDELIYNL